MRPKVILSRPLQRLQRLHRHSRVQAGERWLRALAEEITQGDVDLRAMSLVYTTLLSLVPLLAVSFALLKGFGMHNLLQPFLLDIFEPLGSKRYEIVERIVSYVENMNVGVLGAVGVGMLFYTVTSLLQKAEAAFNHIWRAPAGRSLTHRFKDYLSIILVGPVLVFSALGIVGSLAASGLVQALLALEPFGTLYLALAMVIPYVLLSAAFALLYWMLPNTRVHLRSALVGGVFTGVAWEILGWAFGRFVVTSSGYDAVYSSLAIVIIFMIWLYMSWLIVLLGAKVAFLHQHPSYLALDGGAVTLSANSQTWTGFAVMLLIGERFLNGQTPWTLDALSQRLHLPFEPVRELLQRFCGAGLLIPIQGSGYVPGRPPATISLGEILLAIQGPVLPVAQGRERFGPVAAAGHLYHALEESQRLALQGRSLADALQAQNIPLSDTPQQ